ncbi:MAG: sigma-70 family RNA polymerase sigma factor [Deltaproteobacteria bacterium]|nr:sigma-70 family RNA polymerase sigma factor [Deltaproteobacteria bacterium]MBW2364485.1 sigma-70 family RNA polymerase sigma factor [Deltaproteobacteria bacterium]
MNSKSSDNDIRKHSPETWVEKYGDYLYHYARSRVNDDSAAEDLVQETFLAALSSLKNFEQRASEKTWMTGILKHKVLDYYRKNTKEQVTDDIEAFSKNSEELFDKKGRWKVHPVRWRQNAQQLFEQKEFMAVFRICLSRLSSQIARVFTLRELDGETTEEICKILKISKTNCMVMLHRARISLRRCLEIKWFDNKAKKEGQ